MIPRRDALLALLFVVLAAACGADGDGGGNTGGGDVPVSFTGKDGDGDAAADTTADTATDTAASDDGLTGPQDTALPSDGSLLPDVGHPPPDTTPGSDLPACVPDCAGKECGGDGCGGSCGQCQADDPCQAMAGCVDGVCQLTPLPDPDAGPCAWPGSWHFEAENPVLTPTAGVEAQGADNIYAPDILYFQNQWWMYYGGQGSDGHDAVFLARSNDLVQWQKHPSNGDPQPVVDHGSANHVNDPSVVLVNGTLYMYYTEAPTGEEDEIHLATSTDGLTWIKQGVVLDVGPPGSWEPDRVGRPSVLHEAGQFRMWYDGQIYGVARHVGYATSADGFAWARHAGNPILLNEGAVDVARVGDWYVLLSESGSGTNLFVAKDPLDWHPLGLIWNKSGAAWDQYGQVTPFLLTANGKAVAIFFGGASDSCWCKNRIAMAWPGEAICEPSCAGAECGPDGCGGSCGSCPSSEACTQGQCVPGVAPCSGCLLDGYSDCTEACQHGGHPGGHCVDPNSTDPEECCACDPDTGCEGCLVGAATCMEACQGAGMSYGWCAEPGSQDPAACCACM